MKSEQEIKSALNKNKIVIGTKNTIKLLKNRKLKKVFLTTNTPEEIKKQVEKYSKIANTQVDTFNGTNIELSVICRKSFPISVCGVK